MNLTDQIASMLADAEKATGAFKMPMSLRNAPERIAVDKFNVEARTRLPAALKALLAAVEAIIHDAEHAPECGIYKADPKPCDCWKAKLLATIAKELNGGKE